ncbi:MAG: hypothetical protein FJW86_05315 [Actinobacteria bacterium]|nr:hypothetical protein [Actinomycetota bacterium]
MVDTWRVIRRAGSTRTRIAGLALAVSMLVGACASTGYTYIKNGADNAYFRVPDDWKVYDEDAIVELIAEGSSEQAEEAFRDVVWQVGFDAHPRPSIKHVFRPRTSPAGSATVQQLTRQQSDSASIFGLRNFMVDIDTLSEEGTGAILNEERIELEGGFFGVHLVGVFVRGSANRELTFNQVSLLDQGATKVYSLFVFCESQCYEEHEKDIKRVIDSLTVEE